MIGDITHAPPVAETASEAQPSVCATPTTPATPATPATSTVTATTDIGLAKPGIIYQEGADPKWTKPPAWKPSRLSRRMAERWDRVIRQRQRVGSDHPVELVGTVGGSVDPRKLPYTHWDYRGQEEIIKAYALNDLRCPVP